MPLGKEERMRKYLNEVGNLREQLELCGRSMANYVSNQFCKYYLVMHSSVQTGLIMNRQVDGKDRLFE